jgi:cellulose synthase/poly-beta-1,6-N-acetylglucosamine synthase-like glycosyltransferase
MFVAPRVRADVPGSIGEALGSSSWLRFTRVHKEVAMRTNNWIRQTHRWLSIAFTVAVLFNIVAMGVGSQAVWVGLVALFPLILLMISGLYLFVLPYLAKGRGAAARG